MKNTEWGAVAYLTHSKYGVNGEEVGLKSNGYTTGQDSGNNNYNSISGITVSTTKNIYGIYDANGGAFEYVAACSNGSTQKLTTSEDESYINKYINLYGEYSILNYGDAIYETSGSIGDRNSWFGDFSLYLKSGYPIFIRGGGYTSGTTGGLFYFHEQSGALQKNCSFRPVCIVD